MPRRSALLGVVVALALALAACSSSPSSSSSPSGGAQSASSSSSGEAQSSANSASATGTTINIGAICSCSGAYADNWNSVGKTIQAWANDVNANGGLNGHPVNLILKDDASIAGNSVIAAQGLIKAKVAAIIAGTLLIPVWQKDADAAKIPVIGGNLTSQAFYSDPLFYPSGGTLDFTAYADVKTAIASGAKNIGVIYCSEVPDCQEVSKQIKSSAQTLDMPVSFTGAVSLTAPSYTAQCVAAQRAGAESLFIALNATGLAKFAADCHKQGYDPVFLEQGDGFKMLLTKVQGLRDNLWLSFAVLPMFADKPAVQRLNDALDKYSPGLRDSNDYSQYAVESWTAGLLIEAAVKSAGGAGGDTIDAAAMITALNSIKGEDLGGFSPTLDFTAGGAHSTDCWFTGRVVDGVPQVVDDGKLTCKS